MERHFPNSPLPSNQIPDSRFPDPNIQQHTTRNLLPHKLLQKYTMGWECSVCGLRFDLSESERHADDYDCEVPHRIRRMFEAHKCGSHSVCWVRQRPSTAVPLDEE
ncbi:MAG TPA: hypothetical protein VK738_00085 [Terriglobales bacterium]|jgi:hypothetical protein|nr:hypothetical protein [Terriglobales bacterium]